MTQEPTMNDVQEPITSAPPEVRQIIQAVLKIEKERLDRNDRGHINEDILKIIKEAVQ